MNATGTTEVFIRNKGASKFQYKNFHGQCILEKTSSELSVAGYDFITTSRNSSYI